MAMRAGLVWVVMLGACHGSAVQGSDAGVAITQLEHTTGPIVLDGEWNEPDWNDRSVALVFTGDDGEQARPYSEIRFLRDDTTIYVGMYAADEDIEATDFFQVSLGGVDVRVDPRGHVEASMGGITAGSEIEGTVDEPGDDDEEWLVELAVPIAATTMPMTASRCDITKDQVLRCGRTTSQLVVEGAR